MEKEPATVDAEPAPRQEVWLVIYKYKDSEKIYAFTALNQEQADTITVAGAVARRTVRVRVGGLL